MARSQSHQGQPEVDFVLQTLRLPLACVRVNGEPLTLYDTVDGLAIDVSGGSARSIVVDDLAYE